jgi:hypothetical protein
VVALEEILSLGYHWVDDSFSNKVRPQVSDPASLTPTASFLKLVAIASPINERRIYFDFFSVARTSIPLSPNVYRHGSEHQNGPMDLK